MNRIAALAVCAGFTAIAFSPAARADEWDKRTVLTVNESIQVPNHVLPPGKYVMRLLDSPSNRNIVQIFNGNETHLIATVLTMPNYRLEPTSRTVLTFWEMPPGQPKALRAWFYPGDNYGQEFPYPKVTQVVCVKHPAPTTVATKPIETPQVAEAPPPEQPEVAEEAPPPEEAPAPPKELPKTGTSYPLIGFAGFAALAVFLLLRSVRSISSL